MKDIFSNGKIKWIVTALIIGVISPLFRMGIIDKAWASFKDKEFNYINHEFNFSIILPSEPIISHEKVKKDSINIDLLVIKSIGADNSEYYISCFNDLNYTDSIEIYDKIHNAIDNVIDNSGYELYSLRDTLLNNYPAVMAITKKNKQRRYLFCIIKNFKRILIVADLKHDPLQRNHFEKYFYSFKNK